MKDEIDEGCTGQMQKKKEWSDKRQDIELKREGEVCDRHRENEGTAAEWCRHIND